MQTGATTWQALRAIRLAHYKGELSYPEAKAKAEPYITFINEQAKTLATKHGMRPKKVSFSYVMRALD